ncbi:SGNH/GDSL hydrolase family protein [Extibacter muris]|uniref:SGNH/GDSL hydrolase family protein n=2 Tax=Extibacter muris TaxID=1796622 RepID=A0A4R4FGA6_9FIRM|nr:SGNH/GDSL hydrolase family protein [Extibacter muris]
MQAIRRFCTKEKSVIVKDENRKKWSKGEEQDKILRMAVIVVVVLLIIGSIIVAVKLLNPRVDITKGTEKLKELEQADLKAAESKVEELEEAERAADEERKSRPVNERFANCLVLGDSITQGLYEFGIMDQSLVIAEKGAEVTRPEETGTMDMIRRAEEAKPKCLFLTFGMNDVEAARGDASAFAEGYGKVLDEIKSSMPDTKVYVNCVLPADKQAIEKNEWYGSIPQYNERLKALCEEKDVIFIDNTGLVKDEYYADDGIHQAPDYYPGWVENMAEAADL